MQSIIGRANFWDFRPFSRIAVGVRGFKIVDDYVRLNQLESEGLFPKRRGRLRDLYPDERALFSG